jgi:hypothetical protein
MKRRDVLKAGVAGAASATIGCATTVHVGEVSTDQAASAHAFLASLDHHLALTATARFVEGYVAAQYPDRPRSIAGQTVIEDNDALFRRMLRTLFITQSFRDLPIETQLHPAVQDRMSAHLDEIDETLFALTDRLDGMTAEQRSQLRAKLRDRPDTAMEIGEVIDRHAAAAGLSRARRTQLRSMMSETSFRLRHEAPGALIDEYTAKVRRMGGQDGASALAIDVAQQIGQRAFWHHHKQVAQAGPPPGTAATTVQPAVGPQLDPAATAPQPGRRAIRVGATMMGIGVLAFGAGLLTVATGSQGLEAVGLVLGVTGGAVLFAIGFITLIIGGIIALASD